MGWDEIGAIGDDVRALQDKIARRSMAVQALVDFKAALVESGIEPVVTYEDGRRIGVALDLGDLSVPGAPLADQPRHISQGGLTESCPDLAVRDEVSEAAPQPEPPEAPPAAPPDELVTGPWSPEEEAIARDMMNRGKTGGHVATRLRRPLPGTNKKLQAMRVRDQGAGKASVAVVWTPKLDLEMVDALASRVTVPVLSEAMGIPVADITARWRELLPQGAKLADQHALLNRLRDEVQGDEVSGDEAQNGNAAAS
ncbi:hypothetical protein SAMN04488238_14311 [Roseicitreum antarcticum]|uniref:Uncharacterized protein n=2 Tax=Roseicitreum antarcticum TaxID=564137 RepID=A0A1H3FM69_9RHOB|nr:hypothetical protein SAMN04488238_14311 [Roseicitreum antarcticum]